ncbi:hypothetical protein ANANG_G00168170, partial [Anguilla anguilla]
MEHVCAGTGRISDSALLQRVRGESQMIFLGRRNKNIIPREVPLTTAVESVISSYYDTFLTTCCFQLILCLH